MSFSQDLLESVNEIFTTLDGGHSEKVYQNALIIALNKRGYNVQSEVSLNIDFQGYTVGKVRLDLLVNQKYIIELKAIESVGFKEVKQLQRYVKCYGGGAKGFLVQFALEYIRIMDDRGIVNKISVV